MRIIKAEAHDNERLCQFYNSITLAGEVDLEFHRRDFFAPYAIFSEDVSTYLLVSDNDQIEAMATLAFRKGFLGDREEMIGYATDLRVSTSRSAILGWTQHFLPILEIEKQSRGCNNVFSVVAQMQRLAYNALIRPRLTRRSLPRYHLYRSYSLVTLHGQLPFATKPLESILIRPGEKGDLGAIAEYIHKKSTESLLRLHTSAEEIYKSILHWPNLPLEQFILAFDFQGNLVGCVAPWDPSSCQQVRVLNYHRRAKALYDSVKVLSPFRLARRLAKPNTALQYYYLSHFHADNPDVFYSLLYSAFHATPRQYFLMYPHFEGSLISTPPRSFLTASLNCGLYLIQSPQDLPPDFITWTRQAAAPEFELPFF